MYHEMSDTFVESFLNQSHPLRVDYDFNSTIHNYTQVFRIFAKYYQPVHGYLSLLVCIFGIFANLLNIVVLTRKEMASSTNTILTGLAVADLMVMVEYIPFTIHTSIEIYESPLEQYSYPWAIFTLFHAHFSVIFHSISTWLTVILAIWRYTSVSFPTESKRWCSMSNAKLTIGLTYIIVPIVCIPCYFSFEIVTHEDSTYAIDYSDVSKENNELLKKINFWVYSIGLKILPCILLTHLSLALIRVLMEAERRKQRLKSNLTGARDKLQSQSNEIKYTAGPFKSQRCLVLSSANSLDVTASSAQTTRKMPEVVLNIHEAERSTLKLSREANSLVQEAGPHARHVEHAAREEEDDEDAIDEEEEDEEEAEVNSNRPEITEKTTCRKDASKSKMTTGLSFFSSLSKKSTSAAAAVPSTSCTSTAGATSADSERGKDNDKCEKQSTAPCDLVSPAITCTSHVEDARDQDKKVKVTQSTESPEETGNKVQIKNNSTLRTGCLSVPSAIACGVNRTSISSSTHRESDATTLMTGLPSLSLAASSNTTSTRVSRLSHRSRASSSQSDRTTRMLLAILLLFLLTEFPSGVVTLLSGVMGEAFLVNVYHPLGEVFDILALVNSAINFILYCVMSRLFRKTFCKIFWPQKYQSRYASADRAIRKGTDFHLQQTAISTLPTGQLDTVVPTTTGNNNFTLIHSKHHCAPFSQQLHAPLRTSPPLSDHCVHDGERRERCSTHRNNLLRDMDPIELTETETRRSSFIPLTAAAVPMDLSTPPSNQSTML